MKQNQQQGRRLKPLMAAEQHHNQQQQHQQHTPQKCPRCESRNTKFCYYNNYSLSQPRYFCKACRRYWTQGGTLRNVPVGGGCRKGKRPKLCSSGDDNPTRQAQDTQRNLISPPVQLQAKESDSLVSSSAAMGSYYPASGFLSSLAAIQSMNQPQCLKQPLNQALRIGGGDLGSSSLNLGLLQGYGVPFLGSQHHQQTQFQWPASGNSYDQQNWHQNFINEEVTSTAKITNTSNSKTASSLCPNQWPDLPAYGAP